MSEINVGEYCRTTHGYILKAKDYIEKFGIIITNNLTGFISVLDITKHSFNIIDLIEVGDYVNGWKVDCVAENTICTFELDDVIFPKDIKTIVTHEQFTESEYKVC